MLTKSEIEALESRLVEAIRTSEISFLQHIIHDQLLCLAPDGSTITKEMDTAAHRSGGMIVHHLTHSVEQINIADDTAISVVIYDTKGVMLGEAIEGQFKYLRVWKKFDDGAKVIAASCFKL